MLFDIIVLVFSSLQIVYILRATTAILAAGVYFPCDHSYCLSTLQHLCAESLWNLCFFHFCNTSNAFWYHFCVFQWKSMNINEIHWKSMKANENQWTPMKIIEIQCQRCSPDLDVTRPKRGIQILPFLKDFQRVNVIFLSWNWKVLPGFFSHEYLKHTWFLLKHV